MRNLFIETMSREDLPTYQLHVLADGHGPTGHVISNFIIEKYPKILSSLLLTALKEMKAMKKDSHVVGEQTLEEEDGPVDEDDSSPRMRRP